MTRLQYLNPLLWIRGAYLALIKRQGYGKSAGDDYQLPGVFLIYKGEVQRSHFYKEVWDHPDFVEMARMPAATS